MFETLGHHAVNDTGDPDKVEKDGPFKAKYKPYLGEGYYFWDNHIELAKWWGKAHYSDKYMICEAVIGVDEEEFFDLVGSRGDQIYFQQLREKFEMTSKSISESIELLKKYNKNPKYVGVFPYKVIRAADFVTGSFKFEELEFAPGKHGQYILNPKYIICLTEKNKVILRKFNVVFPREYA